MKRLIVFSFLICSSLFATSQRSSNRPRIDGKMLSNLVKGVNANNPAGFNSASRGIAFCDTDETKLPLIHLAVVRRSNNVVVPLLRLFPRYLVWRDLRGNLPIHLAAEIQDRHSMFFLRRLRPGAAQINALNNEGYTPLQLAVLRGNHLNMEILLSLPGISPDTQSGSNETALHYAVSRRDIAAITILRSHGANVLAQNRLGITPRGLATRLGFLELIEHLQSDPSSPSPSETHEDHSLSPTSSNETAFSDEEPELELGDIVHIMGPDLFQAIFDEEEAINATKLPSSTHTPPPSWFINMHNSARM